MTISVFEIVLKKLFQTDGQLAAWTVEVEIVLLSPAVLVLGLSLAKGGIEFGPTQPSLLLLGLKIFEGKKPYL